MHLMLLKFSIFVAVSRFWVHVPIWVIFFTSKGYTLTELALINSSMWLSVIFFEVPTGYVADRFGRKISLIWSYIIQAVGVFVFVIGTSVVLLVFSGIIWGIGITLSSGAETAWIYDEVVFITKSEQFNRDPRVIFHSWFSTLRIIGHTSKGLALIVGGFLASLAIWLPHSVTVGLFIITASILVRIPENRDETTDFNLSSSVVVDTSESVIPWYVVVRKELCSPKTFALAVMVIIGASFMDIRYFMQLDLEISGVDFRLIGIYFAITMFLASLGNYVSSKIYPHLKQFFFLIMFVLIGILFLIMSLSSIILVMICFGLIELIYGVFDPAHSTIFNDQLSSKYRATSISIIGVGVKIVYIIFSIIFGLITERISFAWGYRFTGSIFLVIGLIMGYIIINNSKAVEFKSK